MNKSANQMWKESGTTLSFKEWLSREKEKFSSFEGDATPVIPNVPLNDSIQKTIISMQEIGGVKTSISSNKTFGIPNWVIIGAGVIVVGAIIYKQIQKNKE